MSSECIKHVAFIQSDRNFELNLFIKIDHDTKCQWLVFLVL